MRRQTGIALFIAIAIIAFAIPGFAATDYAKGRDLAAVHHFSADWLKVALSLQRHTEWVSSATDKEIEKHLTNNGFKLVGSVLRGSFWNGSQAYVAVADVGLVVAFRGTNSDNTWETVENIITDLQFMRMTKLKYNKKYSKVKVHLGFGQEYEAFREKILSYVGKHPDKKVYVTGFSLGAALATLCALDIKTSLNRPVVLYALASPRVGGEDFRKAISSEIGNAFRVSLEKDPVPKIPGFNTLLTDSRYEHAGRLLQLYPNGVPVPANKIETKIDILSIVSNFKEFHQRDKYAKALTLLLDSCEKNPDSCHGTDNNDPLAAAAKAELKASKE
jgi:hypothetical protein